MYKSYYFIIIILFQSLTLLAQQAKLLPFTLSGTINADTGTVSLHLLADKSFYPQNLRSLTTKVKNRQFSFQGYIASPYGFQLLYNSGYNSGDFIIQSGIQSVIYNIDSVRKTPLVDNQIMKEYEKFRQGFTTSRQKRYVLDQKWDSLNIVFKRSIPQELKVELEKELKQCYNATDQDLLAYVKRHPDSYHAFWMLVKLLNFGYEPVFDEIFNNFSYSIKNTYAGKVLANNLKKAGMLSVGKPFPSFPIVDNKDQKFTTGSIVKANYTLIDFWYSNCAPCIAQFPHLKTLYEKYNRKGFEVVAISTDKSKNRSAWQNMINKFELVWPQYWDVDGKEATRLCIQAFPTNVLLDQQGRIIQKNIKPAELEAFLLENIK